MLSKMIGCYSSKAYIIGSFHVNREEGASLTSPKLRWGRSREDLPFSTFVCMNRVACQLSLHINKVIKNYINTSSARLLANSSLVFS